MMSQMDSLADKTTVPPPPYDSWQPTPGELSPSRSRWLLARRLGSIAVVLVLFGIMLSELLSLKRYVPVVAVFGSGYELPWGPIPMTHEDRGLLESLSRSPAGIFQPKVVTWLDASEDLFAESPQEFVATFVSRVAAIRPGGPSKDTVVAYLSCVGTLDAEGRVTFVNRSAERLLDWHEEQSTLALAVAVPEFGALFDKLRAGNAEAVQDEVKVSRNGRLESLLVRMARRRNAEGLPEGYVVAFDDVSELVSAQRMAAWGDVARRIAHEIKNPLTPIQLSAERIKRKFGRHL
ncbi:MAG: PAS domain-containing protein, partial [Rhodobacteraceae bacterium]|nr:PAS domain-containing protein [Paracoccaceae bacterium]